MRRWLLLQLGRAGLAAWATASLVFILSRVLAAGAEEAMLGESNDLRVRTGATSPVARQALRQRLGLDEPVFTLPAPAAPRLPGAGTAPTTNTTTG